VRYVYFHLSWSLIGLIGQQGQYVEMFSRDDLGLAPPASERRALVEQFAALNSLSREATATLARTACLHRAAAGTLVARKGDRNDDVFFLVDGWIDAVGADRTLAIGPGSMFGHDAFDLRRTRTTSYRAATSATCLAISSADLRAAGWTPPA
jgi:CRP-like cAMP-binding protein